MSRVGPTVSVVVPAFNAARTIEKSIESIASQSREDWELIVVDDRSTDDTVQLATEMARYDRRIRILTLDQNSGSPAAPRNAGVDASTGRYVAFLDADDTWAPHKLDAQVSFMERSGAVLSCTAYDVVDAAGRAAGSFVPPATAGYRELLRANTIGCLTAMYDASRIGRRHFPRCGHEDYALWLSILREGKIVHGLPDRLATYRIASGSVSANKLKVLSFYFHIYRDREGNSTAASIAMCLRCAWINRNKYRRQ